MKTKRSHKSTGRTNEILGEVAPWGYFVHIFALDSDDNAHIVYRGQTLSYGLYYATNANGDWAHTRIIVVHLITQMTESCNCNRFINYVHSMYQDSELKYASNKFDGWDYTIEQVGDDHPVDIALDSNDNIYISYAKTGCKFGTSLTGLDVTGQHLVTSVADIRRNRCGTCSAIATDNQDTMHIVYRVDEN